MKKTRTQLPSDASEAAELLKLSGWHQDAMDAVVAGRARLIPLTKGLFALVDSESFAIMRSIPWYAGVKGGHKVYAVSWRIDDSGRRKQMWMHRELNRTPAGLQTDHINGNTLDNRVSNLRSATAAQNQWSQRALYPSRTGFRGVQIRGTKYSAQIQIFKKYKWLGTFDTAEEASTAYSTAAKELRGEFYESK